MGEIDVNDIVGPLKASSLSLLSGSTDHVTEYVQRGVRYVAEKVVLIKVGVTLEQIWSCSANEERFHMCVSHLVLCGDERGLELLHLQPGSRLPLVALRFLLLRNEHLEEPFLFPWEGFVLLAHLVQRSLNVDITLDPSDDEEDQVSKKMHYLLLKVPVARTVAVSAAFQTVLLHVFFSLQISNAAQAERIRCFEGGDFNLLYHSFYRHVLISRNKESGQPWSDRRGAFALAEEFVDQLFAQHADALALFNRLKGIIFAGTESFKHHFPDEFKMHNKNKAATKVESKKLKQAVQKASKKGGNMFNVLRFVNVQDD